jgi:Cd2+/Zn2+-exporting ATPase
MISNSHAAPGEELLQLNIPVILPGVDDAGDGCVLRLQERLGRQSGIRQVHLDNDRGSPQLCLHYDPNLVPLERIERLARDYGTEITTRYHHKTFTVKGMDCASCAAGIEHVVRRVPGVLSVSVNYATERLKVEYDSTTTTNESVAQAVTKLGYRLAPRATALSIPLTQRSDAHERAHDDDHEHAHSHGREHEHDTGSPTPPAQHWWQRHPEVSLSLTAGALLLLAWLGERFFGLPHGAAIALYALAYGAGGYHLARHTIPTVLAGRFDVDLLMLAAAVGAACLDNWAEGAFLLFLFSFGHAMEHHAMDRARSAIRALGRITPRVARVRREGVESEIPVEELLLGDVAIVRPGERIAVDGAVFSGFSAVDQSPITGESLPLEKSVGDEVFAGSINGDGALEVTVSRLAQDTTMARVIALVEEAQSQKSPTQTFTERFERIFVPTVLIIVALAAVMPPLLGWLSWSAAISRALNTMVAASPCALALGTPAAVLAGIAQAARNGVLIKGGVHLENLGSLSALALDKTGTLTRGQPAVTDIVTHEVEENELLRIAAAVETRSTHPLAQAVVRRAQEENLELPPTGELLNLQGRGIESTVQNSRTNAVQRVRVGNRRLFEEAGITLPEPLLLAQQALGTAGKSTMFVGTDERVLGLIALADEPRAEAKSALEALRRAGLKTIVMLSGDNEKVAAAMATRLGLPEFRANLLPEDKVIELRALLDKHHQVAMIGDGVNDAPALATATVGIAMGLGGTDVALETADVALMGDDLSKLPFAVALSRQAKKIIRQNLWIALGVIALLMPSTLAGYTPLGIAVIFHEGSTLVVVANALRLLRFRMPAA